MLTWPVDACTDAIREYQAAVLEAASIIEAAWTDDRTGFVAAGNDAVAIAARIRETKTKTEVLAKEIFAIRDAAKVRGACS